MLHGGPGASHDYLLPQMLALADQHELLFYDQRGGGRSRSDDPQPITWRTHVEDLGGIAREFSLQPLSILGYSWGALLAMLYAIEAARDASLTPPARLVLVEPAPVTREYRRQFEQEFNRRQSSPPISTMREELQRSGLQSRDRDAYRQRAFELSVAGYFADPAKAQDLTPFRIIERVQRSVWESLGDFDVGAELEAVRCPALVIHSRDDPIPVASSERAARALGAQLLLLADCGHVPYVERPTEMFDAVSRFLAETEPLG
jgi:proline iminopeptidase